MAGQPLPKRESVMQPSPLQGLVPRERERQIQAFIPFVKYQALRMASRLPCQVDARDLMNAGIMGLLDAFEKYDASKNTQFKTYAEFRIRGAIIDELRAMDWASRSTREKMKRMEEAYTKLERELQRHPSEEEVAQFLGLEMGDFHHLLMETRGIGLISLEDLFYPENKDQGEMPDFAEDGDPQESYALKEMRSKILEALEGLSERERLVITLYYYEELTMREIGLTLGVTESRVSQIHAQAIVKLKTFMSGAR